ncbi:MAG: helicase [Planctomycetes bacterium]|nr:helicase [Planctomycetota bacterium]
MSKSGKDKQLEQDLTHPALSETRPLFVDNRAGNTMARALHDHLQALNTEGALPFGVDIATAFFNVHGFNLIADELNKVGQVRLMLGAEPVPESQRPSRAPGDPPEPAFTKKLVDGALSQLDKGLEHDRDLLPFDEETDAAVRRLLEMLHSNKIEVRRVVRQFLHAKAYIFRLAGGGSVVGSSNLTFSGLRRNLELNLGQYSDPVVGKIENWFDELWEGAEPYDLAGLYDRLMAEYSPYLIFLRVLYELYGEELGEEEEESGDIPLLQFQQHGVWRALRILRKCGGVLIADGVGLGKTFTAGEIIRLYRERRQRVLLICPAALRDSTWRQFLNQHQLLVDSVSFEQLANDPSLGGKGNPLPNPIDDYALVVIDEAHNYRNPDSPARAGVLRQLLMGQRRDVVMLSATPVNNSLWDLYHLLRYFVKQDALLADRGVLSIRERFSKAMREDPFSLSPDLLYPIIDATTVKRTRKFIKKHYENDLIIMPDGRHMPIRFPKPIASTISYDLEEVLPGFLGELEDALMPADGHPRLTLARYTPDNYLLSGDSQPDPTISGLLRSALLKRFESSIHAFARTTGRMVEQHTLFLQALDDGKVIRKEFMRELSALDDEAIDELLETPGVTESSDQYDVVALRRDVESDLQLLDELHREAASVKPEDDPKLAALLEELDCIVVQAEQQAVDAEDAGQKMKVMIFSFYSDTIQWIETYLDRALEKHPRLRRYADRRVSVSGNIPHGGINREEAVFGFAPKTSGAPANRQDDRFDLIITTDVLAEGMNLQQCRNIINFDLPWNPMRLVQRHGRIDRIGSEHEEVFLRTFFPDAQLDRLLNLEGRVRRKLAQAAASVGVEATPIERGAEGDQSFAETREEIEKLHQGNNSLYEDGGTDSAAQTGEEYRQELRKALLQRGDEIRELPWKAGSGMARGPKRGHFFCARVGQRVYLRFIPYGEQGHSEQIIEEIGTCLRMIECTAETPKVMPTDLKQTAFAAWQLAREHIFNSWTYETDPANLHPRVPKINQKIAQYLREHPPVSLDQDDLKNVLDAIEAPCSRREEKMLRAVFESDDHTGIAKSNALVEEIARIGLEPYQAVEPLPPIEQEDIHLIAWMVIESEQVID